MANNCKIISYKYNGSEIKKYSQILCCLITRDAVKCRSLVKDIADTG